LPLSLSDIRQLTLPKGRIGQGMGKRKNKTKNLFLMVLINLFYHIEKQTAKLVFARAG
jgi:hypothetical protein